MQLLSSCGNLDSRSRNGARRGEHNRAKHGDEEVEIEVKMRGRGHSGGWASSLTLAIFAVSVIGLGSPTGAQAQASPAWPQCGQNPQYTGVPAVTGQALQESSRTRFSRQPGGQFTNSTRARSGLGPDQSLRDNRGPDQVCGERLDGRPRRQYRLQRNPTEAFQSTERRKSQLAYGKGFNSRRGRQKPLKSGASCYQNATKLDLGEG